MREKYKNATDAGEDGVPWDYDSRAALSIVNAARGLVGTDKIAILERLANLVAWGELADA